MKPKVIGVALKDVPNISDVLCVCEPRGGGTVTVFANARGERVCKKFFPLRKPHGRSASPCRANGCRPFLNVPDLARGDHTLPPINGNIPLDEASPGALAYLLAYAVQRQGARAMMWDEEGAPPLRLLTPPQH